MAAVQTTQFINPQHGTDEARNPWCIVQETTQSDYLNNDNIRRVITINSTLTRQHSLAQSSSAEPATNDSYSNESELHQSQAVGTSGSRASKKKPTKSRRVRKNLVRMLLCCTRVGEDDNEDTYSNTPTNRHQNSANRGFIMPDTEVCNESSENVSFFILSTVYNNL